MTINANYKAGLTVSEIEAQIASISAAITEATLANPIDMGLMKQLNESRSQSMKMLAAAKKAEVADLGDEETEAAMDAIKADLRFWLARRDFRYVLAADRYWLPNSDGTWLPVTERALKNERTSLRDPLEWALFMTVLKEDGRYFDRQTYTFKDLPANVMNMLRNEFITMQDDKPHDPVFDHVVASIAGEKAENVSHIEKLILAKYLHPENNLIPSLVLQDEGGTGKSLFVTRILGTIFGKGAVADNLAIEDVVKNFNANLAGKAVWFINETARGRYSLDDLKRKIGSDSFMMEPKGIDAFPVDMTAWVIVSGNDEAGSVKLSGNGVDRRWSIVKGKRELRHILAERMGLDASDAKAWLETTGQHILSDPVEAGRWLYALLERHGDVTTIEGLHGADYQQLAAVQKSTEVMIFEAVFRNPEFSHIKRSTLYELYTAHAGRGFTMARGTLYAKASAWAEKNGIDLGVARMKVGNGKGASAMDFFALDADAKRVIDDHDEQFFSTDERGRRVWNIDIG